MKKLYLLLLGAMMALTASAQNLISSYTVDPTTNQKIWSYEATFENGRLMEAFDTYYYDDGYVYECKTLYTYDDLGELLRTEDYVRVDGEWVITGKVDTEHDADGHEVWITWSDDENNPGQLVQYMKHVIFSFNHTTPLNYDAYMPDGNGGWMFYATIRGEENSQGEIAKLVSTTYYGGDTFITTKTYEYDDHNWLTRETYTSEIFDDYEMTYENFYGADGNIEKRNVYNSGQWTAIQYYTWSDPTAIQSLKGSPAANASWFDLNGRRINGQPAKKGLYIRNGQKVFVNK